MVKKYTIIIMLVCFSAAIWPQMVLAANPALNTLDSVATEKGPYATANSSTLLEIIGLVVSLALGLLGVIFLGLMIYAGYNWMSAQGDEEKVAKAKDTITRAIVGLIIVIGSYAVWKFIFSSKLFQ